MEISRTKLIFVIIGSAIGGILLFLLGLMAIAYFRVPDTKKKDRSYPAACEPGRWPY